jgi:hypothetical protein
MVEHVCNPSTQDTEQEDHEFQPKLQVRLPQNKTKNDILP